VIRCMRYSKFEVETLVVAKEVSKQLEQSVAD
jgi:hypothetical protein